ncbi:amino acid adenylation domain-containing protein [Ancylothrix sp. C2]|uniref:non-ribosomal peptide synthetase n=1 Tax=Ancylothrix sp. D3o TaxID=2953691 RepID=UPI0021BA4268|nr:non-ribosomal peptide synthetase [Ancylothrix sp. D3o]MCT7949710.1 amino acid adenylation domain-containing protein [Ancylothrix sp. D3o]
MNTRNFNKTSDNSPQNIETPQVSNSTGSFLESGAKPVQFWPEFLKDLAPQSLGDFLSLSSKKNGEDSENYTLPGTQEIGLSLRPTSFLKAIAQKNSIEFSVLIQAAWAILLSRYTAEKNVVFGVTPTSGSFNPLPMLVSVEPEQTFISWVKQLQKLWMILADYRHTQIEEIKEWLNFPAGANLFEHLLTFDGDFPSNLDVNKFGLVVAASVETEVVIKIQYNRGKFSDSTIYRLLLHIKTLLENIALNPNQLIKEISNLCGAEYHQIMVKWNKTGYEYPENRCIHQLFEEQVTLLPDAPALVCGEKQLSYNQLNQKANQLAHYLKNLGVCAEIPVVICLARSVELMVAILAVLKAGGGYVPVDPEYPRERISFILEDVKAPILLTSKNLLNELPSIEGKVICLDRLEDEISTGNSENPICEITPENLAYIIYTSGSTGKPKGVLIPHRGVVNHSWYMAEFFGLTPADSVLQFSTISFDIAVEEIYPTWFRGATLVLRTENILASAAEFVKFSQQNQISVWNLPTAFWHELVYGFSVTKQALPEALRLVVVGGEKASVKAYETWRQLAGVEKVRWVNSYGPTETTVTATFYEPGSEIPEKLPIGRPIANTQVYILDENMQLVPVGVPGELYIGGAGVAKGYLNRPETTAERFIPNLFVTFPENFSQGKENSEATKNVYGSQRPENQRNGGQNSQPKENASRSRENSKFYPGYLYKTGDLVRYLADGNIEYVGRLDFQVKIRGYRIELGEIEKALEEHPEVAQTAVIAHVDSSGEKRIVAYVVAKENGSLEEKKLREFLQEKLPKYMMPSALVGMEVLPVTANGKVDRKALPVPNFERSEEEADFVAPQDDLELELSLIWEKILGVKNIGIHDNFFELGGHSLLAVRLLAEIENIWKKRFSITAFLEAPTIQTQAQILRGEGLTANNSSLVLLNRGGQGVPLFCIYGILLYQPLARHFDGERDVYGLYLQAEIDLLKDGVTEKQKAELTSVRYLASQYRQIIQEKQPTGPYFLAGESFGGLVALEIAQQLRQQGEEVALVGLFDTLAPDLMTRLPWHKRIGFHIENMQRDGGQYLLGKLQQRVEAAKSQFLSYGGKFTLGWQKPKAEIVATPLLEALTRRVRDNMIDQAMQNYKAEPYAGKVALFRALDSSQFEWYYTDPKLWSKVAVGELQVYQVPGDHLGILKEPNVTVLAEFLKKSLQQG